MLTRFDSADELIRTVHIAHVKRANISSVNFS